MYKFKIKLLYKEEEKFPELLNLKITLPLAKLDMVDSRLASNGLILTDEHPVNIQPATFFISIEY